MKKAKPHYINFKVKDKKYLWNGYEVGDKTLQRIAFLNAWHNYCMESCIFRLFVKLGLRK